MSTRLLVPLISLFLLAACDRITGEADKKIMDAQAVGYACRVSLKTPEDCMKENDTHSPTYILNGWKSADQDINERVLDPSMGKRTEKSAAAKPADTKAGDTKAGDTKPDQPEKKSTGH